MKIFNKYSISNFYVELEFDYFEDWSIFYTTKEDVTWKNRIEMSNDEQYENGELSSFDSVITIEYVY